MVEKQKLRRGDWIEDKKNQKLLSGMWGEYIDWEERRKKEEGWLVNQLKKYNCQKILDSCVGDGCDAIFLLKQGFDVTGNDIDEVFIKKAVENAKKEGVNLKITNLDWREFTKEFSEESFDAVLCTGNSLGCLFGRENQIEALKRFYTILKKGGILIIDERNYQYVLDNREEILKQKSHSTGCMYYGKRVYGRMIEIKDGRIKFELCDEQNNKRAAYAIMQPFKRGELRNLLEKVGFQKIKQYSDYQLGEKPEANFFMYICQK